MAVDTRHCIPWLLDEVATGLQRLLALGLPDRPPAETVVLTAITWCEVLQSENITWDAETDSARVRDGFRALARSCDRWPLPKQLLAAMPARPKPLALPEGKPNPDNLKKLAEMFRGFKEALEKKGRFI